MGMGERIKKIRSDKKLTQQKFAESIHLKRNTVGNYEIDLIEPSDRAIADICRVFDVNENWLRTGEGDVYTKASSALALDALAERYELRPKDYALIERLIRMSPEQRDGILQFMQDVVDEVRTISGGEDVEAEAAAHAEKAAKLAHDQFLSEKKPGSSASSASGSAVG